MRLLSFPGLTLFRQILTGHTWVSMDSRDISNMAVIEQYISVYFHIMKVSRINSLNTL